METVAPGARITHEYAAPGTYTVTATDTKSGFATERIIEVVDGPPAPGPIFGIEWNPYGDERSPFCYALWFQSAAEADDFVLDRGDGSPPLDLPRDSFVAWGAVHPEAPDPVAARIDFSHAGMFDTTLARKADPRSKTTLALTVNEQPFFDVAPWENNAYRVYIKPPTHPNHAIAIDWGDGTIETEPTWYPWAPVPGSFLAPHTYGARGAVPVKVTATYWMPNRSVTVPLEVQRIRPAFRALNNFDVPYGITVYLDDATSPTVLIDWGYNAQQSGQQGVGTGAAIVFSYGWAGVFTIRVYDENDAGTWQTYSERQVQVW